MNTEKYSVSLHQLVVVFTCFVIFAFVTAPVAQAQEPIRIDLGGFLGKLLNSGAVVEARKEWDKVDPKLKECLKNTQRIDPDQLAQKGISPTDRRIARNVDRCNERLARERRKTEEAERVRQAQLKAQKQARDVARRKREASLKARKAAEESLRRDLVAKYGSEMAEIIITGKVVMGMTREQVAAARGNPARKDVIPPSDELWHYGSEQIAFTSGKVTYIGK